MVSPRRAAVDGTPVVVAPESKKIALLRTQAGQILQLANDLCTPGTAQGIFVLIQGIFGDAGRALVIPSKIGNRRQGFEQDCEYFLTRIFGFLHLLLVSNSPTSSADTKPISHS